MSTALLQILANVQGVQNLLASKGFPLLLPQSAKRGAPAAADHKWIRKRSGDKVGMYYYRTAAGKRVSLGVTADFPDLADEVLRLRRAAEAEAAAGRVHPGSVLLSSVLDFYRAHMRPGERGPRHRDTDYRALCATFERMQARFGKDFTCQQAFEVSADDYLEWRTSEAGALLTKGLRRRKPVKLVTAAYEIRKVRAAAELYWKKHKMTPLELFPGDLPRSDKRLDWLNQAELVRLLVSARRGWLWDARTGRWKTEKQLDAKTGELVERKVVDRSFASRGGSAVYEGRMLARAILFLYYTGSRSAVVEDLGWEMSPDRASINALTGVLLRKGLAHEATGRLKGRPYKKTKRHPAAYLPRPMLSLARASRRHDERVGATYFLHDEHAPCQPLKKGTLLQRLKRAAKRAGLRNGVNVHTMRHTTCTTLLRRGCRLEDVASFVGASVEVIVDHYGHVSGEQTWAGALLMEQRELKVSAAFEPDRPHPLTLFRLRDSNDSHPGRFSWAFRGLRPSIFALVQPNLARFMHHCDTAHTTSLNSFS